MAIKETKLITIEGGLVRMERVIIEREAKAEDFMAEVARMQPLDSGLLPEGCVYFQRWCDDQKAAQTLYLIERAPCMQVIKFKPVKGGTEVQEYMLSWPRTVWCCQTVQTPAAAFAAVEDCAVAVIRQPLRAEGLATKLFRLPMPNLYEDGNGSICTGDLQLAEGRTETAQRVTEMVGQVLASAWNEDLLPDYAGIGIDGLDDWAAKSAIDPDLHEKLAFKAHTAGTVGGLVKRLQ